MKRIRLLVRICTLLLVVATPSFSSLGYNRPETITSFGSIRPTSTRPHTNGRYIVDVEGNLIQLRGGWVFWRFRYASQYHNYDPLSYEDEVNETCLDVFRMAGGNMVRLAINGWIWCIVNSSLYVRAVDTVVAWCKSRGLIVVLDNHAPWLDTDQGIVYRDQISLTTELTEWKNLMIDLARRYANEPTVVGFDLLNEPRPTSEWVLEGYTANQAWDIWRTNVLEVIQAIHAIDSTYLCFVEPLGGSAHQDDMNNFKTQPIPDTNIVYCAHNYYAWDFINHEDYATDYANGDFDSAKQKMEALYRERWIDMGDADLPSMNMETGVYGHSREQENPNWEIWMRDSLEIYAKYGVGYCWPLSPDRADSSLLSLLSSDGKNLTKAGIIWSSVT